MAQEYPFNLRDLRRVIAVAEHRSVRQAALALEVDQGTLTRSIQALEHALRIPLFERMRTELPRVYRRVNLSEDEPYGREEEDITLFG